MWPAELRTALSLVLNAPESMIVACGLDTDRGARDTWWTFSYARVLDDKARSNRGCR